MPFLVRRTVTIGLTGCLAITARAPALAAERELDFRELRAIESGRHAYYQLRRDDRGTYLHAEFQPGDDAVKQALVMREAERRGQHKLAWRWRALVLPAGGNECDPRTNDSAGSVYVAWRRGLRWYGLKYAWSRAHFAAGDPNAEVPDLIGFAVLTDGDETHSASSADFGSFVLRHEP
jgi:hypothetical protein